MCLICVPFLPQSSLPSKKERGRTSNKLEKILQQLLEANGERWTEELSRDIPCNFQRHGDLVLLVDNCFSQPLWKKMSTVLIFLHTFIYKRSTKVTEQDMLYLIIVLYIFRSTAMECSSQRSGRKAPGKNESNI